MKKNRRLQCLVVALIVALVVLGGVSATAFADQSAKGETKKASAASDSASKDDGSEEETVYVLTSASGKEQQRIVSAGEACIMTAMRTASCR